MRGLVARRRAGAAGVTQSRAVGLRAGRVTGAVLAALLHVPAVRPALHRPSSLALRPALPAAKEHLAHEDEEAAPEAGAEGEVDEELEAEEGVDGGVAHGLQQVHAGAELRVPLAGHDEDALGVQGVDQHHGEGEGLDDEKEEHQHEGGVLQLLQGPQVQEVLLQDGLVGGRALPPGPQQAERRHQEAGGDGEQRQDVLDARVDDGPDVVHELHGELLDVGAHLATLRLQQAPGPEEVEVEADEEDGDEQHGGARPLASAQPVCLERVARGDEQLHAQRHHQPGPHLQQHVEHEQEGLAHGVRGAHDPVVGVDATHLQQPRTPAADVEHDQVDEGEDGEVEAAGPGLDAEVAEQHEGGGVTQGTQQEEERVEEGGQGLRRLVLREGRDGLHPALVDVLVVRVVVVAEVARQRGHVGAVVGVA